MQARSQGQFDDFVDLAEGENEISGEMGIDADLVVDIESSDEFTVRRQPSDGNERSDELPWTCTKG